MSQALLLKSYFDKSLISNGKFMFEQFLKGIIGGFFLTGSLIIS
jgi:hypothetical protein